MKRADDEKQFIYFDWTNLQYQYIGIAGRNGTSIPIRVIVKYASRKERVGQLMITVEPLITDTPNSGHLRLTDVLPFIGSNFSKIASGTKATPTTNYIAPPMTRPH